MQVIGDLNIEHYCLEVSKWLVWLRVLIILNVCKVQHKDIRMVQGIFFEWLVIIQPVKKFCLILESISLSASLQKPKIWPWSSVQFSSSQPVTLRSFWLVSFCLCLGFPTGLFSLELSVKTCRHFLFPPLMLDVLPVLFPVMLHKSTKCEVSCYLILFLH